MRCYKWVQKESNVSLRWCFTSWRHSSNPNHKFFNFFFAVGCSSELQNVFGLGFGLSEEVMDYQKREIRLLKKARQKRAIEEVPVTREKDLNASQGCNGGPHRGMRQHRGVTEALLH